MGWHLVSPEYANFPNNYGVSQRPAHREEKMKDIFIGIAVGVVSFAVFYLCGAFVSWDFWWVRPWEWNPSERMLFILGFICVPSCIGGIVISTRRI